MLKDEKPVDLNALRNLKRLDMVIIYNGTFSGYFLLQD